MKSPTVQRSCSLTPFSRASLRRWCRMRLLPTDALPLRKRAQSAFVITVTFVVSRRELVRPKYKYVVGEAG